MNACDDQTEPLGEAPEVDPIAVIDHAAAIGMLSTGDAARAREDLLRRQTQAIAEIRRHVARWQYSPVSVEVRSILDRLGV